MKTYIKTMNRPTHAGWWNYKGGKAEHFIEFLVEVLETPAAGRHCPALRMGGSQNTGFAPWSGVWREVKP